MKRGIVATGHRRPSDNSAGDETIDLMSTSDGLSMTSDSGDDVEAKKAKMRPVARKTLSSPLRESTVASSAAQNSSTETIGGRSTASPRQSDHGGAVDPMALSNGHPPLPTQHHATGASPASSSAQFLPPPPLQKAPNLGVGSSVRSFANGHTGGSSNVSSSPLANGWSNSSTSDGTATDDRDSPASQARSEKDTIPLCRCTVPCELRNSENPPTTCQAVSSVNGQNRGCANNVALNSGRPSAGVSLYRAHVRCPFQALCLAHIKLLQTHHCCPTCGVFCLKGDFNKCPGGQPDHWFHLGCEGVTGACPHCLFLNFTTGKLDVYHQERHKEQHQRTMAANSSQRKAHINGPLASSADNFDSFKKLLTIPGSGRKISISQRLMKEDADRLADIFSRIESDTIGTKYASFEDAIHADDVESVCCFLFANRDVNAKVDGNALLHLAVERKALLIVYLLIEAGANPDAMNKDKVTPLVLAVKKGFDGIVNALLLLGANPNAAVVSEDVSGCTALHIAASLKVPEVVWALIKFPRTNVNAQDEGGWTPLIYAIENGQSKAVELLLDRGAKPLQPDLEGNVALHWAAYSGCVDVLNVLVEKLGERHLDTVNLHKDTPLHVACRQSKWDMARRLLELGADGHLENDTNPPETAESLATALGAPRLILTRLSWSKKRVNNRINWQRANLADDISRGHERIPIRVVNEVDQESPPDDFNYVSNIYESGESSHSIERRLNKMTACACVDRCSNDANDCVCCETDYRSNAYQRDGRLSDDVEWLSTCEVIVECSPACKCDASCQNRVVQKGMQIRVELFKTVDRGWAVRSQQRIPKGTYICEYAGEILTSEVADDREDDTYLFEIESDGHNHCIDAGKFGNISRFINHHCEPNLMPLKVLWDHADRRYPHICFFAKRDIPMGEELTFDYGDKFWEIKGRLFTCKCHAFGCRYNEEKMEEFLAHRERLAQELENEENSE